MSLDEIYQEFEQTCQQESEIQAAKERQEKAERYNAAAARLAVALGEWPLLSKTLGLGVTMREGEHNVYIKGETSLQEFEIMTELRTGHAAYDSVYIRLGNESKGAAVRLQGDWQWDRLAHGLARTADELLTKLRRDAKEEQDRQERAKRNLAEVQQAISLAQEYSALWENYQERCLIWANDWTEQMWEPWELYHVRYVPLHGGLLEPDPAIVDIYCMDAPRDIALALQNGPVADVDVVEINGTVTTLTIPSFLDATPVCMESPTILLARNHHRWYKAGNYYVNVPAWDLREPQGAPAAIISWADYVGQRAGDDLKYQLYRYEDWMNLAEADPKELAAQDEYSPF